MWTHFFFFCWCGGMLQSYRYMPSHILSHHIWFLVVHILFFFFLVLSVFVMDSNKDTTWRERPLIFGAVTRSFLLLFVIRCSLLVRFNSSLVNISSIFYSPIFYSSILNLLYYSHSPSILPSLSIHSCLFVYYYYFFLSHYHYGSSDSNTSFTQ